MKRLLLVAFYFCALLAHASCYADIIYQSSTLGPTGVTWSELSNRTVPGTNVDSGAFPGVRFELASRVVTSQIGGHFVGRPGSGTFFGAIVQLDGQNDFPNSANLSSSDMLGVTSLTFPNASQEVLGNLSIHLDPGWYALVFGSGLFGNDGAGGAVRNGTDFGNPSYFGHTPILEWFDLDILAAPSDNHRFVVVGESVPEPTVLYMAVSAALVSLASTLLRNRKSQC